MEELFLLGKLAKTIVKNAGVASCDEAFYQFHMHGHMKLVIGEIDKPRCAHYGN